MTKETWKVGEEPQEWHDEVEFIQENYSEYLKEWNKKGYIYKPSLLFGGVEKILAWLQVYCDEEDVWKALAWTMGGAIILTLIICLGVIYV